MNTLARLLSELAASGFRLYPAERGFLDVEPANQLTPDLEAALREHKAEILELLRIHGDSLLNLFRDAPTWPPARGRAGPVSPGLWATVGGLVRLVDGREGRLRMVRYDTDSGRVRCRVDIQNGWALLDPEDLLLVLPISPAEQTSRANQRRTEG